MKHRLIAALVVLTMALALFCTGCGKEKKEITVYNWGEYIDPSVLETFEEETGIHVNYTTFETNESLYSTLSTGGYDIDVIIISDYMVSRLASENKLAKLDFSNIPNFDLIGDDYKNLSYDPENLYSVPYMWGTVGLIYNSAMIDEELTSWGAMFDQKYKDQIVMINNSRDAFAIALQYLGYDINTTDKAQLQEAYDLLEEQSKIVQSYAMDQIFDKLESGEAALGVYYAGDYLTMLENNPDLKFVVPEEGSNWFVDAMCIPSESTKQEMAETFINFMSSTEISTLNMEAIGYSSPNTEAAETYSADLDDLSKSVMFPSSEILGNCEIFTNLPQDILELYDSLWTKLKS